LFDDLFDGEEEGESGFDEIGDDCDFGCVFKDGVETGAAVFAVDSSGVLPGDLGFVLHFW
jgi:hypothetical protein